MNLLNILSFILAVIAYSLKELQAHGKLKWSKTLQDFWGEDSWYNKYKTDTSNTRYGMTPSKNNWYTRFFKIKYKERFPLSATALVFLTDGYHLCQLLFKLFLILTLVTYEPIFNMVWDFIIYFVGFGVVFSLVYKLASK